MSRVVAVLLVVVAMMALEAHSLMFFLQPNVRKCLKEEIHKDILVKGDYELTEVPGHHTKLEVVDSKNHILYNKDEAVKGKFAFTTDEYDVFQICFHTFLAPQAQQMNNVNQVKEVRLNVKHGTEAKDYENVSRRLCLTLLFTPSPPKKLGS